VNLSHLPIPANSKFQKLLLAALSFHSSKTTMRQALTKLAKGGPDLADFTFLMSRIKSLDSADAHYVLNHVLPCFLESKDPFIFVNILQFACSFSDYIIRMSLLFRLWCKQPRCFPKLRATIGEALHSWRVSHIKDKNLELAIASTLKYLFLFSMSEHLS
jgi:hypothetical protein